MKACFIFPNVFSKVKKFNELLSRSIFLLKFVNNFRILSHTDKSFHFNLLIYQSSHIENYGEILEQLGFSKYGKEALVSGVTGEVMPCDIFIGSVYY